MRARVIALSLLAAAASLALPQGKTYLLRLKPKVGSAYRMEQTTKQSMGMGGKATPTTTKAVSSVKVTKSNDKVVVIESTVQSTSGAPGADLKGVKTVMTLSPLYQVIDLKMTGGNAQTQALGKMIGETAKLAPSFTSRAVKIGDSWSVPIDMGKIFSNMSNGTMKPKGNSTLNLVMQLVKVTGDVASIKMKLAGNFTLVTQGQEMPVTWSLDGTANYSIATGMTVSSAMTQHQTMKMQGNAMTIDMVINTTFTPAK